MSFVLMFIGLFSFVFYRKFIVLNKEEKEELTKNTKLKLKKALFYSILILRISYYLILQKLNKTVIQINKNTYEISYLLHNKIYKFRTKIRRGPVNAIVEILGSANDYVFEEAKEIEPYLGPNLNFHNTFYSPADFGYKKLIFVLEDGTEQIFNDNEMITLIV